LPFSGCGYTDLEYTVQELAKRGFYTGLWTEKGLDRIAEKGNPIIRTYASQALRCRILVRQAMAGRTMPLAAALHEERDEVFLR